MDQPQEQFGVASPMLRALGTREHNIGALFEAVLTRGPLSRRDAARLTGLSAASVTKLVRPMIDHGYLIEADREAGVPGRPQIPLEVDAGRNFAVGIKLMNSEIVAVVDHTVAQFVPSCDASMLAPSVPSTPSRRQKRNCTSLTFVQSSTVVVSDRFGMLTV